MVNPAVDDGAILSFLTTAHVNAHSKQPLQMRLVYIQHFLIYLSQLSLSSFLGR